MESANSQNAATTSTNTQLAKKTDKDFNYTQFAQTFDGRYNEPYQAFLEIQRNNDVVFDFGKVSEVKGNLFSVSNDYSLAHCVSEDFDMSQGIAKIFKNTYNSVERLKAENVRTGGVVFIQIGKRFIYYMVTKPVYYGKPTYYSLWMCVNKLKEHAVANNVKKIAIPHLACGADRLRWYLVKQLIEYIFQDADIEIKAFDGLK